MNPVLAIDELYLRRKYPAARMLAASGGIIGSVVRVVGEDVSPDLEMANANLGNLSSIFPHVRGADGGDASGESLGGSGADSGTEMAWLRAVMEGAERYANLAHNAQDFVTASARELGSAALDLDAVPRCSARELADPKCPYSVPDKDVPIRWVRGYSLTNDRETLIPAIMTHLYFQPRGVENFWQMISTGVAAHVTLPAALVSAICEVIERDAIALTWLLKLPLARIEPPRVPSGELAVNLAMLKHSPIRHYCFDATTDVGVPTIYGVQLLDGHPNLAQYVNCSTEFEPETAYSKTIREAGPARTVFEKGYTHPEKIENFMALYDGAALLGKPEHRAEFDFLLESPRRTTLEAMNRGLPGNDLERLSFLIERLKSMDMEIVAVDLTTRDLRELGIWVVRVVIPGLMPMTCTQRGRFLGHPRLYQYARTAGLGDVSEDEINPAPQPFA